MAWHGIYTPAIVPTASKGHISWTGTVLVDSVVVSFEKLTSERNAEVLRDKAENKG